MDYIACTIAEIEGGPGEGRDVYGGVVLHLEAESSRFIAFDYGQVTNHGHLSVGQKIRAFMTIGFAVRYELVDHPLEFQIGSGRDQLCGEILGFADLPALVKGCRTTSYAIGQVKGGVAFRVETGIGEILLPARKLLSTYETVSSSGHSVFVKATDLRIDMLGVA